MAQREQLRGRWPRLFGVGAESARGLLSAIAGSMITVAGVTFSITIVALALASSQYPPRILRNFMRDRANQAVLGVFVGVFDRSDGRELPVITRGATFPDLLAEAFDQIRQNAEGNVAVLIRLLQVLGILAERTSDHHRREALRQQTDLMIETSERSVPAAHDRARIEAARRQVFPIPGGQI